MDAVSKSWDASESVEENDSRLWQALRTVQDPELPVNIVDLGLIYGLEQTGDCVNVRLTFTAMGCPCTEFIIDDVRTALLQQAGVKRVDVDVVWDPPWTRDRISAHATEALKSWGIVALTESLKCKP